METLVVLLGRVREWAWVLWNYLLLYLLGAWYLLKELSATHRTPTGLTSQKGRVAIVTGGGRGIGLETVRQFLQLDMTVVVAGRCVESLEATVAALRAAGVTGGVALCLNLDLASLSSVRTFASEFLALGYPLHVLVNNAGIMFWPKERTVDGHEAHWSVNYLGHFLLTHLLLPSLKTATTTSTTTNTTAAAATTTTTAAAATTTTTAAAATTPAATARLVNLTSSIHHIGSINFEDPESKLGYNAQAAYAQSKLAQMMFTLSMEERFGSGGESAVVASGVHPGVVATELFQHVAWFTAFPFLATTFLKTPRQGCDTVVHCALSSDVTHGGCYYENCTVTAPAAAATRRKDRDRLWNLSCHQLDIKVFGQE